VLIPDHKQKDLFDGVADSRLSGKTLIFAHGLSVAFELFSPPVDCDVLLVAPHGPGLRIREKYLANDPFTAFVGVHSNYSGNAGQVASAYAIAIGCPAESQFETSFKEEAIGDIFGEQTVLCGGLVGLMESGFETLVKKGLSPESAYLECIYQIDLIVDLIKKYGPAGMFKRISVTAAYGSLTQKDELFNSDYKNKLQSLYKKIESGKFSDALIKEYKKKMKRFDKLLNKSVESPLQKAHDKLPSKLKSDN